MPTRAERRAHEPSPGPDLDERGRDDGQPVDRLHRQAQARAEGHEAHDPDGDTDRDRGLDAQLSLLGGVFRIAIQRRLHDPRRRRCNDGRPDLIASRFDRSDQLATPDRRVDDVDGRLLGGQVDGRIQDAVSAPEEIARCG